MARTTDPAYSTDPVTAYLASACNHPILTAEEERALGRRISDGLAAEKALGADPPPTGDSRRVLAAAATDGRLAQQEFATANLKLVVATARRHRRSGQELADAIADGNLGLLTAVRKFDWRKGFKFSTYATFWIRQAIDRGHQQAGRSIRLPGDVYMLEVQMSQAGDHIAAETGDEPTAEALAAFLNRDVAKVRAVIATRNPASLEAPVGDGDSVLGDLVAVAPEVECPDEMVAAVLAELRADDRAVLDLRFGLSSGRRLSIEAVAARLGISPGEVRRRTEAALERARASVVPAA